MTENLRLNLEGCPPELERSEYPEPGDVYSKAGGPPGFWVVVAISKGENQCIVLSFDTTGRVTGAQSYGISYFRDRGHRRCGRVEIPTFDVEWLPYERRM